MHHTTLTLDGHTRRYWLALPERPYPALGRPPLVVFLHGTGATARWADGETGWSAFLAPLGVPLLLPEGLPPDPRKISKFLTNPQRWNDGTRSASDPFASAADDVAFLDLAIAEAIQKSGADPSLVLLTGFSNGASMSYRYAVERADHLAAIAPVASYNPLPTARLRSPVPTLVLLGGSDPLIPYAGGMVRNPWGELRPRPAIRPGLDAWATALGCSSPAEILQSTAEIERFRYPGPVEYQVVIHRQLGHHWPGGKGQLGEEWGGPFVPVFPSAVEQIWDFFQTHILSKPPAPRESGKPTAG